MEATLPRSCLRFFLRFVTRLGGVFYLHIHPNVHSFLRFDKIKESLAQGLPLCSRNSLGRMADFFRCP